MHILFFTDELLKIKHFFKKKRLHLSKTNLTILSSEKKGISLQDYVKEKSLTKSIMFNLNISGKNVSKVFNFRRRFSQFFYFLFIYFFFSIVDEIGSKAVSSVADIL